MYTEPLIVFFFPFSVVRSYPFTACASRIEHATLVLTSLSSSSFKFVVSESGQIGTFSTACCCSRQVRMCKFLPQIYVASRSWRRSEFIWLKRIEIFHQKFCDLRGIGCINDPNPGESEKVGDLESISSDVENMWVCSSK